MVPVGSSVASAAMGASITVLPDDGERRVRWWLSGKVGRGDGPRGARGGMDGRIAHGEEGVLSGAIVLLQWV